MATNLDLLISQFAPAQARSVQYAYTHVRTWSDQKILKFLAIVSILNILLVRNQDFVMKAPLWLNSKN